MVTFGISSLGLRASGSGGGWGTPGKVGNARLKKGLQRSWLKTNFKPGIFLSVC